MLGLRLSYSCAHRLKRGVGTLDPLPTRTTAFWALAGALCSPRARTDTSQIGQSKQRLEPRCAMLGDENLAGTFIAFLLNCGRTVKRFLHLGHRSSETS